MPHDQTQPAASPAWRKPALTVAPIPTPWYREPWPWLLMSGPALVIVAGVITTTMAFRTADGLVASDYYKQGLMINRTLARDDAARKHHLVARAGLTEGPDAGAPGAGMPGAGTPGASTPGKRLRLTLTGDIAPPALSLRLVHPTRAGLDRTIMLTPVQPGVYEGMFDPAAAGTVPVTRWLVTLEQGDWRLTGEWRPPAPFQLTSVTQ